MSNYGNYPITEEYKAKCREAKFNAMSEEDQLFELYRAEYLKGMHLTIEDKKAIMKSLSFAIFKLEHFSNQLGNNIMSLIAPPIAKFYTVIAWIRRKFSAIVES